MTRGYCAIAVHNCRRGGDRREGQKGDARLRRARTGHGVLYNSFSS